MTTPDTEAVTLHPLFGPRLHFQKKTTFIFFQMKCWRTRVVTTTIASLLQRWAETTAVLAWLLAAVMDGWLAQVEVRNSAGPILVEDMDGVAASEI